MRDALPGGDTSVRGLGEPQPEVHDRGLTCGAGLGRRSADLSSRVPFVLCALMVMNILLPATHDA